MMMRSAIFFMFISLYQVRIDKYEGGSDVFGGCGPKVFITFPNYLVVPNHKRVRIQIA